jgi:hypothetical protein
LYRNRRVDQRYRVKLRMEDGLRTPHAQIVTSSPYMKELRAQKDKLLRKARVKRQLLQPDSEKPTPKRAKKNKKKAKTLPSDAERKKKEKDVIPRHTCGQRFCDVKSGKRWTQCQKCTSWFHNSCQCLLEKSFKTFCYIACD